MYMPAFSRLLVLSALAFAASVQSAPIGIVESRELGHVSRSAEPDSAPLEARHFRFPNLGSGDNGGEKSHHSGHRRGVSEEDDAGPFQARRFRFPKNGGSDDAGEKSGHSHGSGHRRGLDNEDDAGPFQARHFRSKTGGDDKGSEKSHHSGHHRRELDDDSATPDLD